MRGRVKMFKEDEGFGFISFQYPVGGLTECFVHKSQVDDGILKRGWTVQFTLDQNKNDRSKIIAMNVRVLSKSPMVELPLSVLESVYDAAVGFENVTPKLDEREKSAIDFVDSILKKFNVAVGEDEDNESSDSEAPQSDDN